jgi:hypothetical protein
MFYWYRITSKSKAFQEIRVIRICPIHRIGYKQGFVAGLSIIDMLLITAQSSALLLMAPGSRQLLAN